MPAVSSGTPDNEFRFDYNFVGIFLLAGRVHPCKQCFRGNHAHLAKRLPNRG